MSTSIPTVSSTGTGANDIWRQHELQIRDLYQNQKKTLKQVKAEMEKNGFPQTPLSTWASKLRVDLRIQKKNKADHWPLVYRHLTPRLEKPGKKRLRKPTTIRLDGKEIPFDEAWKEIRRSGAHILSPRLLPHGSLPCGIQVRTPSPVLSQGLITEKFASSVASVVPMRCGSTAALQLYAPQTAIRGGPPRIMTTISTLLNETPITPWVSLSVNLQNLFRDTIPIQLLEAWKSLEWWKIVPLGRSLGAQEIMDFKTRLDLVPTGSPRFPRPSHDLGHRLVMSRGNISLSDFISTSIYLLSNGLHDIEDADNGLQLLCLLFEHDVQLFTQILQCELSTGRAAWGSLIVYSKYHDQRLMYRILLDIGIHQKWLDLSDPQVLLTALEMDGPTNVIVDILNCLYRSGCSHWRDILDAILMASRKGYLDVANLLVQRFDINAAVPFLPSLGSTSMSVFLAFVLEFEENNDSHWHILDYFLANGADVDRLLPSIWYPSKPARGWYNKSEITRALRPTILDHSFRLNRNLFQRLLKHSKVPKSTLTKTGLLISLEKGQAALRDYLNTRVPAVQLCNWRCMRSAFEFLFDDQCHPERWEIELPQRYHFDRTIKTRGTDLGILRSLIQCGVDWKRSSIFLPDFHSLLESVLLQLRDELTDDGLQLLDVLVQEGAEIKEGHLRGAVEMEGNNLLNWLQPRVKNFSAKAAAALAEAARLNNFEAVEFLLQCGADPNAFIDAKASTRLEPRRFVVKGLTCASLEKAYSVQAVAAGVGAKREFTGSPFEYSSLRMCQFLTERGTELVVSPNDSTPFEFAMLLLENGWGDVELFAKIRFVFSTSRKNEHWTNPPAFLLELCVQCMFPTPIQETKERLKIFEYLLDEGADVNPGSPLAALIRFDAPKELVERVLHLGAKLDGYTAVIYPRIYPICTPLQAAASKGNEELVYLFLEQGADVNSPARGNFGMTALQAICSWDPATEKDHRRKMTICDLLMTNGAEINAAPARRGGVTALQAAVIRGDLELTAMLIRNGAHVNALSGKGSGQSGRSCALDDAVSHGRLDIAKLLLNANALSRFPGMTGYDGVLRFNRRHHAVTSLIRDHVGNSMKSGTLHNSESRTAEEDYELIYGRGADDEVSDDDYWNEWGERSAQLNDTWTSTDEESSENDTAEYDSSSESDSSIRHDTNSPEDVQGPPNPLSIDSTFMDDSMSYSETRVSYTEGIVHGEWENEPVPGSASEAWAETLDVQNLPDFHVVPNDCMDDQVNYSGAGCVLTEGRMQMRGANETMVDDALEPWAGMLDDGGLWQQVFEMQDLDLGLATFDAGLQMSPFVQSGGANSDGQDAAEPEYAQEL